MTIEEAPPGACLTRRAGWVWWGRDRVDRAVRETREEGGGGRGLYLERRLLADEAVHRVGGALGGRVAGDGGGGGGLDNGRRLLDRGLDDVGFIASTDGERTLAARGSVQLGAAALDVEVARHKGAHCGCVCVWEDWRGGGETGRYSTQMGEWIG